MSMAEAARGNHCESCAVADRLALSRQRLKSLNKPTSALNTELPCVYDGSPTSITYVRVMTPSCVNGSVSPDNSVEITCEMSPTLTTKSPKQMEALEGFVEQWDNIFNDLTGSSGSRPLFYTWCGDFESLQAKIAEDIERDRLACGVDFFFHSEMSYALAVTPFCHHALLSQTTCYINTYIYIYIYAPCC